MMDIEDTKEKKKGLLICACKEADKNCYLTCAKGRRIEPDKVFVLNWRKG